MFPEILVAVAAILIGDAPACDQSRAMAVGKERAEREGVSGPTLESSIGGPYDWSTFSAERPYFANSLGETLSLFLEQHRFYFVRLTPKRDPRVSQFGGGFWSFIDASTCEVLFAAAEK